MDDSLKYLESCTQVLEPKDDFRFPFHPYQIQKDFMSNLYKAIEGRKLAIFESPTGTGKTLSIICGALAWLKDHEEREIHALEKAISQLELNKVESSTDWLSAQIKNVANDNCRRELQLRLNNITKKSEQVKRIKEKQKIHTIRKEKPDENKNIEENDLFLKPVIEEDGDIILEDFDESYDEVLEEDDKENEIKDESVKIIFCSRTHSQLSQFIHEIKRTIYKENIRVVHLASRQMYCINKAVQKLNIQSLINEKCLEMQKSSSKKATSKSDDGADTKRRKKGEGGCCPKLKNVTKLGERIISDIHDVEEVLKLGEELGSCPYYASRQMVSDLAQVVVVPYNTLLHKSTREACDIKVENNVVIIDEAHNLLETISHIHSTQVTGLQLTHAYSQLTQYRDKYEKRFTPFNLLHLNQLIFVIGALIKFIGGKAGCGPNEEASLRVLDAKIYSVADFIMLAEIDNYNIYTLLNFCEKTKISRKLHGYTERYTPLVKSQNMLKPKPGAGMKAFIQDISNKKNKKIEEQKPSPVSAEAEQVIQGQPLIQILSFLNNLTQNYAEGRVVVSRQMIIGKSYIKYLLLDPASSVSDIINKARCVILAGGTMQPVSEFKDRLFSACGASDDRILEFSCGHVIPPENILPIVVSAGPTGKQLDFSFNNRDSALMLNELGRLLINVCTVVPAGVVCFFPSYDYESKVFEHLEKNNMLQQISSKKKLFREPKMSSKVDTVLAEYAKTIQSKNSPINGALLFSVVGGKLSEGLNFSDDLGRCVIVVGMPYPNIKSPELQEKMFFLKENVGPQAGREHYENLCMKAVNQSIGRAVRHKADYSTMLLLDHRYGKQNIQELLPTWIRSSLKIEPKFGPVLANLVKFFKYHKVKGGLSS
ncbi:ATP-dependent DNA helicase DDX11 isoform X1 [Cimex lectularius]|uniref:Helicase ATP-binding domain-containing protein n=1 Tax=Cimex lectularius TaxID=79782 RepID=A0A8I6RJ34_CIMLE|nr:ATP-dependent DNA helicase DDX11 isoform X1 [Cimex lectularius]